MRKGLFYICLLLVGVGLFAGCKSKKAVVASFSDLDGEWGVVEMNGKTLNPEETHQVLVFDVARQGLSGNAGCNRLMGKIEYNDAYKNIIKFPQVATTRMACPDMNGERELLEALNKVVRFEAQGEAAPVTEIALFGTQWLSRGVPRLYNWVLIFETITESCLKPNTRLGDISQIIISGIEQII